MKANKRGAGRRNQDVFLCLREKPPQWDQVDNVIVFLSEVRGWGGVEGLGGRKRKTGSHVLTQ